MLLTKLELNVTFATEAAAPLPPPPTKVIAGFPPYPLPPETKVNVSSVPCPTVAVTAAPLPEVINTEGAEVYPVPPAVTFTAVTTPPLITADAVAPDPPPPESTTFGAAANPLPPLVTFTAVTAPPETDAVPVAPPPTEVNVTPIFPAP